MCLRKKMKAESARVLTFGKNFYGGQDLRGCINDSNNLIKKTSSLWTGIDFKQFTDNQVTAKSYLTNLEEAISSLSPGAVVCVITDSCFSESVTRFADFSLTSGRQVMNRCFNPGYPAVIKKAVQGKKDIKWIHFSACQENQTAADCYEGGQYVGALTYFLLKVLRSGMTYGEWFEHVKKYLPSKYYSQVPTIEGPDYLLGKVIMKDQTLWIHNSSHGSYQRDVNGDEADGQDEGLYFDRLLIDDEINKVLNKIPV